MQAATFSFVCKAATPFQHWVRPSSCNIQLRCFGQKIIKGKAGCSERDYQSKLQNIATLERPLSIHDGYVIEASLIVDRLPTRFREPKYVRKWREFRFKWEDNAGYAPKIHDDILFMKYPFHFYEIPKGGASKSVTAPTHISSGENMESTVELDLDSLLGSQGFKRKRFERKESKLEEKGSLEHLKDYEEAQSSKRSLERLPEDTLYLLVKTGGKWSFPNRWRVHGDSMRETLEDLCREQLGKTFLPHFVGYCPILHSVSRFRSPCGIINGCKSFYYRAHHIPGKENVESDLFDDFAWVTIHEMKEYIAEAQYYLIRQSLYLE